MYSLNIFVVFFGKSIKDTDLESIGPTIENHELFPKKTNVEIVEVINSNLIDCQHVVKGTTQPGHLTSNDWATLNDIEIIKNFKSNT